MKGLGRICISQSGIYYCILFPHRYLTSLILFKSISASNIHSRVNRQLFVYTRNDFARLKYAIDQCQLFVYPRFVYILFSRKCEKINFIMEAPRPSARSRDFESF